MRLLVTMGRARSVAFSSQACHFRFELRVLAGEALVTLLWRKVDSRTMSPSSATGWVSLLTAFPGGEMKKASLSSSLSLSSCNIHIIHYHYHYAGHPNFAHILALRS